MNFQQVPKHFASFVDFHKKKKIIIPLLYFIQVEWEVEPKYLTIHTVAGCVQGKDDLPSGVNISMHWWQREPT